MNMLRKLLLLAAFFPVSLYSQYVSEVWSPDCGDGTYANPVLFADYSDPDVCAVGEDYFLTASSFNCVPGLPVLHSRDLVNWSIVGHALKELLPHDVFDQAAHGKGVWAPAIRFHDGFLYIYWGDPDQGIFMVKAERAEGPWSEPVLVVGGKGLIDPCPLWDDDGRCYLVNAWANSRAGFNSVLTVRELSADGSRAVGNPRIVFDGGQVNHTAEGPKLYKRDGYYWILCPAGGVEHGWQLAMRSSSIFGPYEWRRVMEQGKTDINGPHQGAWVHTEYGEDWFLHFNDKGAYGRVVFLQPVDWSSSWPMMGRQGEPVMKWKKPKASPSPLASPQESDEFDDGLGLQWQWHGNYNEAWGQPVAGGFYRLYTQVEEQSLWLAPNLLLQKLSAPRLTATACVRMAAKEDGQRGEIVVMGRDYSALAVCSRNGRFVIQRRTCIGADEGNVETVADIAEVKPTERDTIPYAPAIYLDIYLRLTVNDGNARFAYSLDGRRFTEAGSPFTMRQGKWIGAKYGFASMSDSLKSSRGWMDVDWLRVTLAI